MIDGSSPGPSLLTITAAPSESQQRLVSGQRLVGRVLSAAGDNQFVLALGAVRIVAASVQPLVVGQPIAVDVIGTGASLALRLVSTSATAAAAGTITSGEETDQALALASLVHAVRQSEVDPPPATSSRALLASLAAALPDGLGQLTTTDLTPLAHLLPIEPDHEVLELAARLKAAFENGGQLFEAHLRSLLDAAPRMPGERALDLLHDDARVFLGRTAATLAAQNPGEASAEAQRQIEATAAQILAQQARLGMDWVAHGIVSLELPVTLSGRETRATITLQPDHDSSADGDAAPAFRATFRVTSEVLGPVDTRVSWMGGNVDADISVSSVGAHALLEPELAALKDGLSATFARVSAQVRVDPSRTAGALRSAALPALPGGSLLNVRG